MSYLERQRQRLTAPCISPSNSMRSRMHLIFVSLRLTVPVLLLAVAVSHAQTPSTLARTGSVDPHPLPPRNSIQVCLFPADPYIPPIPSRATFANHTPSEA